MSQFLIKLIAMCIFITKLFSQTSGVSLNAELGNILLSSPVTAGSGNIIATLNYGYIKGLSDIKASLLLGVSDIADIFALYSPESSLRLSGTGAFGVKIWLYGRRELDRGVSLGLKANRKIAASSSNDTYEVKAIFSYGIKTVNLYANFGLNLRRKFKGKPIFGFGFDFPVNSHSLFSLELINFNPNVQGYSKAGAVGLKFVFGFVQIYTCAIAEMVKNKFNTELKLSLSLNSQKIDIKERFERFKSLEIFTPPPLKRKRKK